MIFNKKRSLAQMIILWAMACIQVHSSMILCMEEKNLTTTISDFNLESGIPVSIARSILDPLHPIGKKVFEHFAKKNGSLIATLSHNAPVTGVSWSSDRSLIATSSDDKTAKIWKPSTGTCKTTLIGHTNKVNCISWSPNNSLIATASSEDKTVKIWDPETGKCITTLGGFDGNNITKLYWSADSSYLATDSNPRITKIWDVKTGTCIFDQYHNKSFFSIHWAPKGSLFSTDHGFGCVDIRDAKSGKQIAIRQGHQDTITSISWSPDGKLIATTSDDHTAKIWDPKAGKCIYTFPSLDDMSDNINIEWAPNSSLIIIFSDRKAKIWDLQTGNCINTLSERISYVFWSPDSLTIAIQSQRNRNIKIFDVKIGTQQCELIGHKHFVYSMRWFSDDSCCITGSFNETNKLWNTKNGTCITALCGHLWDVSNQLDYGSLLATTHWDNNVYIWKIYGSYEHAIDKLLKSIISRVEKTENPIGRFWKLFMNIILPMTK